jgi:hypothetical protein
VINERNIYLVHGHHLDKEHNDYEKGSIVFYGHTHVSKCEKINDVYYINPGSTTIPKENTSKSMIVFDGIKVLLIDLDGNLIQEFNLD